MPRGGFRSRAGRPKGAKNKRQRPDPVKLAAESGLTPLDYLLNVMRDEAAPAARRDWAAEKAAQYCHPRLALMAYNNTTPRTVNNNLTIELVVPEGHDIPGKMIDHLVEPSQ